MASNNSIINLCKLKKGKIPWEKLNNLEQFVWR